MNMPDNVVEKIIKQIEEARRMSVNVNEFFDRYCAIFAEIGLDIDLDQLPNDLRDQKSSHDSPIGRPQAWSQSQQDDPDIPNTYPAYSGTLGGTITNNTGYSDELDSNRLFWAFGHFEFRWIHAKPSSHKREGNSESFNMSCFLFIEDFPAMYTAVRKELKLEEMNHQMDSALDKYKVVRDDLISDSIKDDTILADLESYKNELQAILSDIGTAKDDRKAFIRHSVHEMEIPLPIVKNKLLNLNRYNKLKTEFGAAEEATPDFGHIFNGVKSIETKLQTYLDSHPEDFL